MTLGTAIDRYLAEHLAPKTRRHGSLNTCIYYLGIIRSAFGADMLVEAITNSRLSDWWGELVGWVQPNTAKRYLVQCKAVLAFAQHVGGGMKFRHFPRRSPRMSVYVGLRRARKLRCLLPVLDGLPTS